ncbi:MAG: hypothetical protein HYT22_00925 [Candidatus Niyogibacteria bacterium]|nr:hypothetical protein [Candidatus Niyogibacteria bacterium]
MKNRNDKVRRSLEIAGISAVFALAAVGVGEEVGFFVAKIIVAIALFAMPFIWLPTTEEKARISAEKERRVV